jgi:hypothetical protein
VRSLLALRLRRPRRAAPRAPALAPFRPLFVDVEAAIALERRAVDGLLCLALLGRALADIPADDDLGLLLECAALAHPDEMRRFARDLLTRFDIHCM